MAKRDALAGIAEAVQTLQHHLYGLRPADTEPAVESIALALSDVLAYEGVRVTPWRLSYRADPIGADIADRHYNRQSVGAPQFVPPGTCLVLLSDDDLSLWVTSWPKAEYVMHAWPGAWVNSTFRREGGDMQASDMIRLAVAHTRHKWPDVPELGMVTMVDASKVKHKRDPGRCYAKAGFRRVGSTKSGLLVWQLLPEDMPEPLEPQPERGALFVA
jgi:hypothetical protein